MKLNSGWHFREVGKTDWHKATVPGCVHTDLLDNKLIDDPFYRDNEKRQQWIGKTDWEYQTTFRVTPQTLARENVEPLGYLDTYMTTLGYRIVPTIARVKPGFTLTLNTGEVDVAFEVPLAFLMDQANVQRHSRDWQGMTRHFYAITYGERYIWGVTAGILRNLHDRIYK